MYSLMATNDISSAMWSDGGILFVGRWHSSHGPAGDTDSESGGELWRGHFCCNEIKGESKPNETMQYLTVDSQPVIIASVEVTWTAAGAHLSVPCSMPFW
jgi:hypothetical protein